MRSARGLAVREDIAINAERLLGEIEHISGFSDVPAPAVTRILYTPTDMAARRYLKQLADAAGLPWREDALGNWFVRLQGTEPDLPAVATGSHIDAIPYAGKYDGVVGVLGGLEALRAIQEAGVAPRRSLELIMFTAEEPTRFGVGCLGSRGMAGLMPWDALRALRDTNGVSLEQARADAGYTGELESVELSPGAYAYFVELHIEQGPFLEAANREIGIVTDIVASTTVRVTLTGEGGHAGTVPMPERNDALAAAAELALLAEKAASFRSRGLAVATVGMLDVHPGASNSIPSRVDLTLDVRSREMRVRDAMLEEIHTGLKALARSRRVQPEWQVLNHDPACQSDPRILAAIARSAEARGYAHLSLVSRAYHDTVFMARHFPAAMIFIPCYEGYSHRPEEFAAPEHIVAGTETLASTLVELAML